MDISLVIPTYNEEESLRELTDWIVSVMIKHNYSYEIIYIDDGSTDKSWEIITSLSKENINIKAIRFRRNYGKSAALNSGFEAACGDVVFTMDSDLQDNPEEIPEMYTMIMNDNYDLVSGWKKKRYDPISKTIPTKLYNWATRRMTKIKLHDFNCGLKAYKRDVIKTIEVYGEMHRYIPVIARRAGFKKIGEKVVKHQKRKYGTTKFGMERFVNGFLDLLSISFVSRFGKRPMHLFGSLGTLSFFAGGIISVWLVIYKIYGLANNLKIRDITDQPLFYLALLAMIIGSQLFLTGFLAEMISRNSTERNKYLIKDKINL
ncbi:MAG: glycosyltransferase family 2 protein [Bacteroidales bacterium]|nr:glycosyltransferase family 2 protein [Bacteroidales bacterium]